MAKPVGMGASDDDDEGEDMEEEDGGEEDACVADPGPGDDVNDDADGKVVVCTSGGCTGGGSTPDDGDDDVQFIGYVCMCAECKTTSKIQKAMESKACDDTKGGGDSNSEDAKAAPAASAEKGEQKNKQRKPTGGYHKGKGRGGGKGGGAAKASKAGSKPSEQTATAAEKPTRRVRGKTSMAAIPSNKKTPMPAEGDELTPPYSRVVRMGKDGRAAEAYILQGPGCKGKRYIYLLFQ